MKIVFIFLICLNITAFGEDIKNYQPELLIKIETGKKEGQIAYDKYGLPHHSRAFAISKEEKIYICDPYNQRIVIYDLKFIYQNSITTEDIIQNKIFFADIIYFDDFNNLIALVQAQGLYKLDKNGKKIIEVDSKNIPSSVLGLYHFYPIDDVIVFYEKDDLKYINLEGEIISTNSPNDSLGDGQDSENKQGKLNKYIMENGILNYEGKIFPKNYKNLLQLESINSKLRSDNKNIDLKELKEQYLLGYDNDNNMYWKGYWGNYSTQAIAIFSKELVLIDIFTYKLNGNIYQALAPNGDIYIMQPLEEGVFFYKIPRRW